MFGMRLSMALVDEKDVAEDENLGGQERGAVESVGFWWQRSRGEEDEDDKLLGVKQFLMDWLLWPKNV